VESCDALIVGGGPAGSTCARSLRRAGLDVLVVDCAVFPRDKPCAGWVTPGVWKALELEPEEYGAKHLLQPISRFRIGSIGSDGVETDYGQPVSFGIRRCEFDHALLARSGARVQSGTRVTRLRRAGKEWVVNDQLRTPILVGAGGHFCPVARVLGTRSAGEVAVAAQEVEWHLAPDQRAQCRVEPGVPELYFSQDLKGYGWCFRKKDHLNVGLGRVDRVALSRHLVDFVEGLQARGRLPSHLPRWRGHAYLLNPSTPRPAFADAAVLVGDAAGLAYMESGEGIRPAVESGLLAARTILDAAGDYRRENLEPYQRRLERTFGEGKGPGLARFIPPMIVAGLGSAFLRSRWFTRHVVLDRWFLRS